MKAFALSILIAGALCAWEGRVHAQQEEAPRVVVLSVEHDAPLRARLAAELRSQGFEPVEAAASAELAMRVEISPAAIHLWIANAATGKKIEREAPIAAGSRPDSAIVSLWAVEALRASAVAPVSLPKTEAAIAAAPPSAPARPFTPYGLYSFYLGPAVTSGPGDMGLAAHIMLGARRLLSRRFGAELFMNLPTIPTHVQRAAGSTVVHRGMAGAGPYLTLGGPDARWSAQLGAGAALAVVRVSGTGADGFVGRVDHLSAGGPYARLGGALKLTHALRLRLDGVAGVLFPAPTIYFADERVAAWGRPWITVALDAEATF